MKTRILAILLAATASLGHAAHDVPPPIPAEIRVDEADLDTLRRYYVNFRLLAVLIPEASWVFTAWADAIRRMIPVYEDP